MSCYYHSDRSAVNTCSKCGAWLCDGCSVEIDGRVVCKACISRELSNPRPAADPRAAAHGRAYIPAPSKPRVDGFLLFLFSMMPGANYMYMGLIKRGLCMMAAFFGTIYATAMLGGMPFAFLIPILAVTSMFDGFRLRRLINAGTDVPDNIDDVREFIRTHRAVLITVLVAGLFFGLFNGIVDALSHIFRYMPGGASVSFGFGRLAPWIFIGLGCFFLFRRRRVRPGTPAAPSVPEEEQYIDKR